MSSLIFYAIENCGSSSVVERKLPKLDVAGSIPVSRSIASHCNRPAIYEVGRFFIIFSDRYINTAR